MKPEYNLEAMRLGVEYQAKVYFRGKAYRIRPLSAKERLQCNEDVVEYFSKKSPEMRLGINEALVIGMFTLEVASTSKPGVFDPELPMMFLENLTSDEISYLWKQYTAICQKVNPEFEEIPAEEIMELVEQVKKSPERATLIDLSFFRLVDVCLAFVKESQKLHQDS